MSEVLEADSGTVRTGLRFNLRHVPLNSGGYTYGKWGTYYGAGQRLYQFETDDMEVSGEFRACDRADAVKHLTGFVHEGSTVKGRQS